jgi:hypothetical protein
MSVAAVEEQPRVVEYRAHPYQLDVLQSKKFLTFIGAGVGAGKTDVGSLWTVMRCKESTSGVIGMIAANTYPQLFDATLRNAFKNFDRFGIAHRPIELPKSHSPFTLELWNGERWVEILCRSMERYENLSGVELGWAWMDEVWQTQREAYDLITARVRDIRIDLQRILLTTTLDDPASWMYEEFVDKFDGERMLVRYATTLENERNLRPGYVEDMKRTYSDRLFQRMVMAKWVTLSSGQVYYNFSRAAHVSDEAEFEPQLPILWAHDFNIGDGKPMSSCLCQIKKGPGVQLDSKGKPVIRPELHVFDELILETADTQDAIREFGGREWAAQAKAGIRIYGDASGKARDTRSKKTDYAILREAGYGDQRVPDQNPPIRDRHNAVNSLLKNAAGDIRVKIHSRCKALAKGLETVKLKTGAQYLEVETREQHVTTAFGYLVHAEFPIAVHSGGGGRLPWFE